MQEILNVFNQGWFGNAIGIIGILLAFFFYLKSKKSQILAYETKSLRLIGKEEQKLPQKIEIFFDNEIVDRLTSTQLWIWNDGNETIDGSKIVVDDPIKYVFDNETKILSTKIITKTRDANKVKVICSLDNEIRLDFDFLDSKDGVKIEILHTGKMQNPKMVGTIKGMPQGIKYYSSSLLANIKHRINNTEVISKKASSKLLLSIGILMLSIGILPDSLFLPLYNFMNNRMSPEVSDFRFFLIITGIIYTFLPLVLIYKEKIKYPAILDIEEEQKC